MKHKRKFILLTVLLFCMVFFYTTQAFAAELTEAEVEQAVAEHGKETVTGNVFIWFLCAIAFLKVSQKIDAFMSSLGINVGNTGGNMMAELLIAGRSLSNSFKGSRGGYSGSRSSSPGSAAVSGSFLAGGLAGSVGRHMERSAVNHVTGYSDSGGIGSMIYKSSLNKGGDFANQVIGDIAKGNYGQVGSIKGAEAEKAFHSYMNVTQNEGTPIPSYENMEIGGGRITGTETSESGSRDFAMYHADQYMTPNHGDYETVQAVDGSTWYKQYAQPSVEKTPYEDGKGGIAYQESIVQKLPPTPARKDRV